MAFGQQITIGGALVSPNLGLRQSQATDADAVAAGYGARLLTRVSTRDVRRTADNPTGRKRVHPLAPNRDPLVMMGSGVTVGPISGKYNGRDVFGLAPGATGSGTAIDLKVGPKSFNDVSNTGFTLFGVAHFDSAMLGSGSLHSLVALLRDGSNYESMLAHQYAGSVNYLTVFTDQGDGNGVNHVLDGSASFTAGTPFVYCLRIQRAAVSANLDLWVNTLTTPVITSIGKPAPESGAMELMIGHTASDSQQWTGAHGDAYLIAGDALATADDLALATALMLEMRAYYGV